MAGFAAAVHRIAAAISAAQNDLLQPPPNVPPAVAAAERLLEVSVADAAEALRALAPLLRVEGAAQPEQDPLWQLVLVQHAVESLQHGAVGIAASLQAEASASRHQAFTEPGALLCGRCVRSQGIAVTPIWPAEHVDVPKLDANRKAFAKSIIRQTAAKLRGNTGSMRQHVSVEQHVKLLIATATAPQRLCRMYEGWTAWL